MKTLLVVDEDKETLDYVRDLLKDSGYSGLFAENGEAAQRLAGSSAGPDLLLAALTTTPGPAESLAHRLASAFPALKTVFMSSHPLRLLERNGIRAAGVPFLQKPFTRVRLLKVLDVALEITAAAGATEAAPSLERAA